MIIENGGHFRILTLNHAYDIWKKSMFIVENTARKLTDSFYNKKNSSLTAPQQKNAPVCLLAGSLRAVFCFSKEIGDVCRQANWH